MKANKERIQKVLSAAGLGSRRQIEAWVEAGRIRVNGRTASPGEPVGPNDRVQFDGRLIRLETARREVIMYHKPVGELVTRRDPQRRPTVFKGLPKPAGGRWVAVGRLDINSSGLLLLTTDGELAQQLTNRANAVEREYLVRVRGKVDETVLRELRDGVALEDGMAHFDKLTTRRQQSSPEAYNRWYEVIVTEGRNRLIRRMWAAVDCEVSRLMRVRYGPVKLPDSLRPGQSRPLGARDLKQLLSSVDAGAVQNSSASR